MTESNLQLKEDLTKHLSIAKEVSDRVGEGRAYGTLKLKPRVILQVVKYCQSVWRWFTCAVQWNLRELEEAIEYQRKCLSIAREKGDRDLEGRAYCNLGIAYYGLRRFQEAKECYQSSVEVIDIMRASLDLKSDDALKMSFWSLYGDAYDGLWKTLLLLDLPDEALCAAERGRAQALVDGLKIRYGLTALPPIFCVQNKLPTTTVFLALHRNIITFWVVSKENTFEVRQRELKGRGEHENSVTFLLKTTLKKIGADVFVKWKKPLLELIDDFPSIVRPSLVRCDVEPAQNLQCTVDSLQPLHDAIIGPIADLCQGDELIIVPDGPLCLAPFSALSESIRIRTVPSLTCLKLITDSPEDHCKKNGALLVGDPCLEKVVAKQVEPMYNPLPCAKMEVEMIGKILNVPPLTGTEATKEKVMKRITSVTLVHIAARGIKETGEILLAPNAGWEDDQGQGSGSKTKTPKEEDYILTMSDVIAIGLRARLVVLSCAYSGCGEVNSQGVVGIAWAFLAAGARSVLASLWAISDEATMEFMKIFYQNLKDGERASVALHQAMKTLRESEKFCAARYWAPFVLIGDDVTLELGNQTSENCK